MKDYKNIQVSIIDNVFSHKRNDNDSFISFYQALYKKYLKEVENNLENREFEEISKEIGNVYNKTKSYISLLLTGEVVSIHQSMSQWWFNSHFKKANTKIIEKGSKWFRIRTKVDGESLNAENMGYVPLSKRNILKNFRYSLSGTPCLYAGKSVLGCWEEMRRPPINAVYVTKVTFNKDIKLLDLRLFQELNSEDDFKNYLILFPLIIACSIKVPLKDDNNRFKPEYIIPQIFMQSIMKKDKEGNNYYQGIIYNSTQMDKSNPYNDRTLYENIAIPIRSKVKSGQFVDLMSSYFSFSAPINMEYGRLTNKIIEPTDKSYASSIWGQTERLL